MPDLRIQGLQVLAGETELLCIPQLELASGTLLGVSGPSGAGKTTLLNALAGLIPMQGRLSWGETDLGQLGAAARTRFRRLNMGMIFQDFLLFEELTALENAAILTSFSRRAHRRQIRAQASALLTRLGLADRLDHRADQLSGGERQRVATARALAHEPKILLADEPTASLDRATADALIRDLTRLARDSGQSVITVSHDPAVLAQMDRQITLVDGRVQDV